MNEIILTEANFDEEVLRSELPVLVDFYAGWCGPCRMLSPVISEIAQEFDGKIKVGKVNTDEQARLAARFHIDALPTVIVFADGKRLISSVGYRDRQQILALLPDTAKG